MAQHTLHVIGWLGVRRAYLDIDLDEAKRRYCTSEHLDVDATDADMGDISTFQFDDEFAVYDAWVLQSQE